jgi:hypothetical protein
MFSTWRERGLSTRAANILCAMNCQTLEDVQRLGQKQLIQNGAGVTTFNQIASLMDWPLLPPRKPVTKRREVWDWRDVGG